jgi:hypothetical protein
MIGCWSHQKNLTFDEVNGGTALLSGYTSTSSDRIVVNPIGENRSEIESRKIGLVMLRNKPRDSCLFEPHVKIRLKIIFLGSDLMI